MVVLIAAAAGCGGHQSTPSTPAATQPRPTPAPVRLVTVTVVDGDTGRRIPGAAVTVQGGSRRGRSTFALPLRRTGLVSARAPRYETSTLSVSPGGPRNLTVRLYRPAGQWPLYGATPARTQFQPAIHVRPPFRIAWGRNLGGLLEFPAVVADGVAYLTNAGGRLFALAMDDGRTLWQFDIHSPKEASSPAVVGDRLIVHAKTGRVLMLDRASGRLGWSWATSGEIESSPVVQNGVDYFGDWAGNVYALDLRTRKPRWTYHDGCKITASVAVSGGTLYVGDYCGRIVALEQATGRLLWSSSAGGVVYGTSAVAGGRVFVPSRGAEALYAFTTGGSYLWHVSTGGLVYSAPAVWHDRVYFGSYTGTLYCVSASTGSVLWQVATGGPISGSPTVIDGIVYVANFAHRILGVDAATGKVVFTFPHGEYVAVSGNAGKLLLYGWSSLWAVEPR